MVKFYNPQGIQMCKWPRNQSTSQYGGLSNSQYGGLSTSQYGGLSTSQYGGLSTSQGGGLSTSSSNVYMSNIPPWSIFVKYLYNHGYSNYADFIMEQFQKANLPLLP